MTGQTDFNRTFRAQPGRIDDVGFGQSFFMLFPWAVATFAGDVQLRPALRVMVGTCAVAARAQFEIRPGFPIRMFRIPPIAFCRV